MRNVQKALLRKQYDIFILRLQRHTMAHYNNACVRI